jgi:hypothetical protein
MPYESQPDTIVLAFHAGGNGYEHQDGGWSYPEPHFTWTLGYQSDIILPAPRIPGAYEVALDLFPFTAPGVPEQPLSLHANGEEIGRFAVRAGGCLVCRAPWNVIARAPTLTLTLRHPGAAQPSRTKPDNADSRLLAFAVKTLTLRRLAQQAAVSPSSGAPSPALREMRPQPMLRFESLGMNCELGLVQRRCGAEPLGLLRFAFSPMAAILAGLEDRFEKIGRPETTDVRLHALTGEYQVLDRAYGFLFHTWIYRDAAVSAELHHRECRRLPRLARKLLETLEEADKILVFRGEATTIEDDVRRIVALARNYGRNRVLWVRAAEVGESAGTARDAGEGLLMGWVDRLAPMHDAAKFSFESWIDMLESASEIRSAQN